MEASSPSDALLDTPSHRQVPVTLESLLDEDSRAPTLNPNQTNLNASPHLAATPLHSTAPPPDYLQSALDIPACDIPGPSMANTLPLADHGVPATLAINDSRASTQNNVTPHSLNTTSSPSDSHPRAPALSIPECPAQPLTFTEGHPAVREHILNFNEGTFRVIVR
jgi:hypothetical protein